MGIPEAGSWEVTDIKNHPKGGSFFFLKFSDTRFNSHSLAILMNYPDTKFNSLSHPVIPSYPCSVNKESWPTGGRFLEIHPWESRDGS